MTGRPIQKLLPLSASACCAAFLLASCGNAEAPQPHAKGNAETEVEFLQVGPVRLFALGAAGNLLPTAPRVTAAQRPSVPDATVWSGLVFARVGQVTAGFGAASTHPNSYRTGVFLPQDFVPTYGLCAVDSALLEIASYLSKISGSPVPGRTGLYLQPGPGSCELKESLTCMRSALEKVNWSAARTDKEKGLALQAVTTQLVSCTDQALGSSMASLPLLSVTQGELSFFPSPLYSLAIYPGALSSYDDALIEHDPVVVFSPPVPCRAPGGRCLHSPLPRSECKICGALIAGETYTAFLLTSEFQRHDRVLSVTFPAP